MLSARYDIRQNFFFTGYRNGYQANGNGNGEEANSPPVIIRPDDRSYSQSQSINPFAIIVLDESNLLTVTVEGLPDGLAYDPEESTVRGTVADDAETGGHSVTITADDGEHVVTGSFTVTVTQPVLPSALKAQWSSLATVGIGDNPLIPLGLLALLPLLLLLFAAWKRRKRKSAEESLGMRI